MNAARKGALVDLRPGCHEVVHIKRGTQFESFRKRDGRLSQERAFSDEGNFVTDPTGREIPGNRGSVWPETWSEEPIWPETSER